MPEVQEKDQLTDAILEQVKLLEAEFEDSGVVLELEGKREDRKGLPRYNWVVRRMVEGKPVGHYALVNCFAGRSGAEQWVLIGVYNQSPIEIKSETFYSRKNLKANAKNAFKRVKLIVETATAQDSYNKARHDEKRKMERLTKEELGDVDDLVDSSFRNLCQERMPIDHLQRFDDGTYKVVMRTKLSLNQMLKLRDILRETK